MKLILITAIIGCFFQLAQAQEKISDPELSGHIDSLIREAKRYRAMAKEMYMNGSSGTKEFAEAVRKQSEVDSSNWIEVKRIINQNGYPGFSMVGKTSAHNFWTMLQFYERDMDLQSKAIPLMKVAVDRGDAAADDYAYLIDKYLINKGEPQIYGTQIKLNEEHTGFELKPTIEPEKLDVRRKEAHLKSITEYIKETNERYYKSIQAKK